MYSECIELDHIGYIIYILYSFLYNEKTKYIYDIVIQYIIIYFYYIFCLPNVCKTRWYNIRDQYRKVLNKKKTSGQAATKQLKYKYDDQLSFLKKTFQERSNYYQYRW